MFLENRISDCLNTFLTGPLLDRGKRRWRVRENHLYGWNKGDTCVMITNKAKRSTSEYIVESYDGVYFGIRSHTGLYHRVSPWRMFRTKEEAIETLAEQKYGGISL